jgi:NADPH:quinone reductase-like Zn-dependent oxidoreductase
MRAAILREYGGVPELGDHPEPEGPGAVEVLAAAMNPVDVRICSGTFPNERHEVPYIAGKEGVGRRADGSLVYFDACVEPFGAFAPLALPDGGYDVPEGLDPALAVCLGVSGLAAWLPLSWRAPVPEGGTVLILGASGVVGQIGVQAARILGAGRVVAAARSEEGLRRAAELGADATVTLTGDDAESLREAAGEGGYDVVLDPLWGAPAAAAIGAMKPFGKLVALGQSAAAEATLSSAAVRSRPVDILGYTNYTPPADVLRRGYEALAGHAAAGRIRVAIERFGLDDVPDVWVRQATSPHAKQVIEP